MLTNVGLSSEKGMCTLCNVWIIKRIKWFFFGINANIGGRLVYKVVILEKKKLDIWFWFKKWGVIINMVTVKIICRSYHKYGHRVNYMYSFLPKKLFTNSYIFPALFERWYKWWQRKVGIPRCLKYKPLRHDWMIFLGVDLVNKSDPRRNIEVQCWYFDMQDLTTILIIIFQIFIL